MKYEHLVNYLINDEYDDETIEKVKRNERDEELIGILADFFVIKEDLEDIISISVELLREMLEYYLTSK